MGSIEGLAGQSRHQFGAGEAGVCGCVFTGLEQCRPHPAPGGVRRHEEGADLGGIARRIEQAGLAAGKLVPAEQRRALAPAAAAQSVARAVFHHQIGAIRYQLRIDAEHMGDGGFGFRRRVETLA